MVIDLVVKKELDGYSAVVPSIKGCETWAKKENEAIEKILELVEYYLRIKKEKIIVDKARKESDEIIYKLVFDKQTL
jgi:predicted RNase H-like HicB family nuclease